MATEYNLGKVVGNDATINGYNAITLDAGNGVELTHEGAAFTLGAPNLQPKTLSNPISVDGVSQTTVEGALSALSQSTGGDNSVTAHLETTPAAAAHSDGDYIYYNDIIYEVIDDIAIGDTLIVGTNISAASLPNGTVIYIPETGGGI